MHHTVARIAQGASAYILTGCGIVSVLRLVLAFLLQNKLLRHNLVFFVDGQRALHAAILSAFAWFAPLQIILDWYHLGAQPLVHPMLCGTREVGSVQLEPGW